MRNYGSPEISSWAVRLGAAPSWQLGNSQSVIDFPDHLFISVSGENGDNWNTRARAQNGFVLSGTAAIPHIRRSNRVREWRMMGSGD